MDIESQVNTGPHRNRDLGLVALPSVARLSAMLSGSLLKTARVTSCVINLDARRASKMDRPPDDPGVCKAGPHSPL